MERLTDERFIAAKLRIDYLRKNQLHFTADLMDALIAEIEPLRQAEPLTVQVEIPPLYPEGTCSEKCPLICDGFCKKGWLTRKITDYGTPQYRTLLKPGPPCPRYKEKP